ncbi:N-acyl amino acid synthase FeeM domain-containing protein [Salisaeta longa]|uniref:N-acyl amino acid synthase FeeM domain-containing protein n=1 Tax=Salisaeta longa TaxID=503170 RepID=UPI0003B3D91F|nr:hypothetical protein [Salisaeta longa]
MRSDTTARRATTAKDRAHALDVLRATYAQEKQWVAAAEDLFPAADLNNPDIMWAVATVDGMPAGVLRVHYAPPLMQYAQYNLTMKDGAEALDVEAFIREHRIAEIGRFAVRPRYRRRIRVVFKLMQIAACDTLQRGFSHYVTDVFEGEEHSPYNFHTRVLGFRPIATHAAGEMDTLHRRITLVLDIQEAFERLRASKNRLYTLLVEGLDADSAVLQISS